MARILLIEDDPINIELYKVYLENNGHEIIVCTNGNTGIDTMLTQIPDLLILDLMLPDMSGDEIYDMIKKIPSVQNIPVILVTAFVHVNQYVDKFPRLPKKCFLHKPIIFPYLIKLIDELLTIETEN